MSKNSQGQHEEHNANMGHLSILQWDPKLVYVWTNYEPSLAYILYHDGIYVGQSIYYNRGHFKVTLFKTTRRTIKPLPFPSLITQICKSQGVMIPSHLKKKLRMLITKTSTLANYTNELENVQGPTLDPQPTIRGRNQYQQFK